MNSPHHNSILTNGSKSTEAWSSSLLSKPFDLGVAALCHDPALRERVEACGEFERHYLMKTLDVTKSAFEDGCESSAVQAHAALFALYELHTVDPDDVSAGNQHDPLLHRIRKALEDAWLQSERQSLASASDSDAGVVPEKIKALCAEHRASSHPLFDFLAQDADKTQMERFFISDSALNIRFFDLLALALVGSCERSRPELVQNLWDESGRGERGSAHVRTFRDLLDTCSLSQNRHEQIGQMPSPGFAGHNLFMLTALNRAHYYKSLGVMAVTELLDPASYKKVVAGCRRLGLSAWEYRYYSEHVEIDVVHGQGWLDNVITPTLERAPSAAADIIFGAKLRLSSCQHYYDGLLSHVARSTSLELCEEVTVE